MGRNLFLPDPSAHHTGIFRQTKQGRSVRSEVDIEIANGGELSQDKLAQDGGSAPSWTWVGAGPGETESAVEMLYNRDEARK